MSETNEGSIVVSLPVADRPTSSRFYRALLDRQPPGEPQDDGEPEPLQFWLTEGTRLMLIPRGGFGWVIGDDHQVSEPGQVEVVLTLEAPDEAGVRARADTAASAGGKVVVAPGRRPYGYVALVADPDGHLWQIISDPQI